MLDTEQEPLLGQSIGTRLRVAREAKGLSLDDVARQTRIPIRHLEHIEREEWDALPAITYSVGFARSYANTIGLDGAEVGAEVRQQLGGSRASGTTTAAYYEPTDPARVPPRWIAFAAIAIALLLALGYFLWRSKAVDDGSPAEVAITASETPDAPAAGPAQTAAPVRAPAPTNGPVVLTAAEDVWLRIDQGAGAGGSPLYMGTLKAGQSYQVPAGAQAPRIRTARANALRVTVGGTPVPPLGPAETTISNVSLIPADLAARTQAGPAAGAAPPSAPAPQ